MTGAEKPDSEAARVRLKYGAYLKKEREGRQYTQKYVADRLGFRTPQLISNWERGIAVPPLKEIRKLAQLYAVDRDELITIVTEYQRAVCTDTLAQIRRVFAGYQHPSKRDHLDS